MWSEGICSGSEDVDDDYYYYYCCNHSGTVSATAMDTAIAPAAADAAAAPAPAAAASAAATASTVLPPYFLRTLQLTAATAQHCLLSTRISSPSPMR